MNKSKLANEGKKWVEDGLISEEQLQAILSRYQLKDHRYLLVLFATLFVSIGILIYALSDWAQVSHTIRIGIMIISMLVLYGLGDYYYKEETEEFSVYPQIVSISFLVLGYIFFGATLLLLIHLYDVIPLSVWPYIIWALAGLVLYFLYPHKLIFLSGIAVTVYSQLYSSFALYEFSLGTFLIFLIGYGWIAYKRNDVLMSSFVAGGLVIHSLIATNYVTNEYYWIAFYIFIVYISTEFILKQTIRQPFYYAAILSIYIYKTFETFMLQGETSFRDILYEPSFFILLSIGVIAMVIYVIISEKLYKLIDISLFIPLFFLPFNYVYIILSMFIFSLFYLIYGFQQKNQANIMIGTITFLFSTFTAYVQYAWETLNKSLFFIIGGLLLFGISFVLERLRRKREQGES